MHYHPPSVSINVRDVRDSDDRLCLMQRRAYLTISFAYCALDHTYSYDTPQK